MTPDESLKIAYGLLELTQFRRRVIEENSALVVLRVQEPLTMEDLDAKVHEFLRRSNLSPGLSLYYLASLDAYALVPSEKILKPNFGII